MNQRKKREETYRREMEYVYVYLFMVLLLTSIRSYMMMIDYVIMILASVYEV
jgi:hypothetical protein